MNFVTGKHDLSFPVIEILKFLYKLIFLLLDHFNISFEYELQFVVIVNRILYYCKNIKIMT
jgi:hypothetical protein